VEQSISEANDSHENGETRGNTCTPNINRISRVQEVSDDKFSGDFDDADNDDEMDPIMREKLDREVEDFARRLNSDWPERMQEILASGQEPRKIGPVSLVYDSSLKRFTSLTRS